MKVFLVALPQLHHEGRQTPAFSMMKVFLEVPAIAMNRFAEAVQFSEFSKDALEFGVAEFRPIFAVA